MCAICEHRPKARGKRFCANCLAKLNKAKNKKNVEKPVKFATYQGHVIGFFPNGKGLFAPRLLRRKPENLPKGKTLNLNEYIDGFSREQVKKIKSAVLQLAAGNNS